MIRRIIIYFWPSIPDNEIHKFSLLSFTFFSIIGTYWLLKILKEIIFFKIAFPATLGWAPHTGRNLIPIAKTCTPIVLLVCVLIYSKLVDTFKRHHLFYAICSFYGILFGIISALLMLRKVAGDAALGKQLLATIGWVTYFGIESYGSLIVALFWSFVISITPNESSKIGFPIIITGAQLGAIGGSALTLFADKIGGVWPLFLIATLTTLAVMPLIAYFMRTTPPELLVSNQDSPSVEHPQQEKPGFVENFLGGLRLLVTRPYLMGVFVVSTFYDVVATIVEYQMQSQASVYPQYATETGFSTFVGIFGVCTNTLSLLVALLGASYLLKRYGLRFCLLIYPVCFGLALGLFYWFYRKGILTPAQSLWASFGVMMIVKGLSYAVNNPTKEMMYIPTSKAAKFKAKGWVDMFGSRIAKMGGSQITNMLKGSMENLMVYGTAFGLALIGVWGAIAFIVGTKNIELIKKGEIIE